VDALSPLGYAMSHLPGAINMTPEFMDERARRRIPDLNTRFAQDQHGAIVLSPSFVRLDQCCGMFPDKELAEFDAVIPTDPGR
jgi:hypothetical protein